MADTEKPGEAADEAGAKPPDPPTTVGPNLPLQVQRNAEETGDGSSPADDDGPG